jgi:hypothetical protein
MSLYQHFLSLLHNLYLERNPQLKNEDGSIKLEALPDMQLLQLQSPNIDGLITAMRSKTAPKKYSPLDLRNRGPSNRNL